MTLHNLRENLKKVFVYRRVICFLVTRLWPFATAVKKNNHQTYEAKNLLLDHGRSNTITV